MNLRALSVFVQVVKSGGFTAAARVLEVPKSAVSAAVSKLEEEVGVRLLHRTSRTVVVTEEGAQLFARCVPALDALHDAAAAITEMQSELKGLIRVTAPVEVGTQLLEPVLSRFLLAHPGVHVDVSLSVRVVDLVDEGFDLALRGGRLPDSGLVARKLGSADAGLFASPAYLKAHGTPKRVTELAHHDGVLLRAMGTAGAWSLHGPGGVQRVEIRPRVVTDHFPFVLRAVLSGLGVGLLPHFLCTQEVTRGELVRVLPRFALRATPLHVVVPSARHVPRRVVALRDFIVASLAPRLGGSTAREPRLGVGV